MTVLMQAAFTAGIGGAGPESRPSESPQRRSPCEARRLHGFPEVLSPETGAQGYMDTETGSGLQRRMHRLCTCEDRTGLSFPPMTLFRCLLGTHANHALSST